MAFTLMQTYSEVFTWRTFLLLQTITFYLWIVLSIVVMVVSRDQNITIIFFASWGVSVVLNALAESTHDRTLFTACANQAVQVVLRHFLSWFLPKS